MWLFVLYHYMYTPIRQSNKVRQGSRLLSGSAHVRKRYCCWAPAHVIEYSGSLPDPASRGGHATWPVLSFAFRSPFLEVQQGIVAAFLPLARPMRVLRQSLSCLLQLSHLRTGTPPCHRPEDQLVKPRTQTELIDIHLQLVAALAQRSTARERLGELRLVSVPGVEM